MSAATVARARLAGTIARHPDRDVSDLRAELEYAKVEDAIRKAVDSAPQLTPEQRERLALLLSDAG